jgi:hypothetical protein
MLTPRIETVIAEKQGKVLLAKVDIDENTDLALDYQVSHLARTIGTTIIGNVLSPKDGSKYQKWKSIGGQTSRLKMIGSWERQIRFNRALHFQVGSVPVLIAMKDGKVLERVIGLQDTDKLRQFVGKYTE